MSNFFYHLKHLPQLDLDFLLDIENAEFSGDYQPLNGKRVNFNMADSQFSQTSFFAMLQEKFGAVYCYYTKMPPCTTHKWHSDINRNCAINFLLTDCDSLTLFESYKINDYNVGFEVCNYTVYQPTLFNTTIPHMIINHSDQIRYLLSVSIPRPHTFLEIKDFLINYHCDHY
jgi:hypothetical protein